MLVPSVSPLHRTKRIRAPVATAGAFAALLALLGCSDKGNPAADGGSEASSSGTPATCASPGAATDGPADDHCSDGDGGLMVTAVDPAVCKDIPDGATDEGCPYGNTMYGHEAYDDDCKYHVVWSSTPICEGSHPVIFTMTATFLGTTMPVSGAAPYIEPFTTTPIGAGDAAYCDTGSLHADVRNTLGPMREGPPGTYTGAVYFDQAGAWTIRFHLNANCNEVPGSPHGHAAFHLTVP